MKWEQMELPLGLDAEEADDDEVTTDAFIKGALEGRLGVTNQAQVPQTAFVVIINADGEAEAHADPSKFPKYTMRSASLGDIRRACNEIVTEINLQTSARITAEAINPVIDTSRQDSIRTALTERGIEVRK